jgi:hypothetical protein
MQRHAFFSVPHSRRVILDPSAYQSPLCELTQTFVAPGTIADEVGLCRSDDVTYPGVAHQPHALRYHDIYHPL